MNIKFDVRGVEELQAFLKSVPRGTIRAALDAMTTYIIGNDQRGLKHYPVRVAHDKDNPYKWQSEKQRRAYFATGGFGKGIPYKRTGGLKDGWQGHPTNNGYRMSIVNKSPYAEYVQGDKQQRGHAADKWRKIGAIVQTNLSGAFGAARKAVKQWLDEHRR